MTHRPDDTAGAFALGRCARGLGNLAGSVLVALALTGCGQHPSAPARHIKSIHMAGVYAEAAKTLAAEFERESGIHVTIVAAPLLSLREKELTDLLTQGGNYDVMQVAHQWEGELLPHLRPLDDLVSSRSSDLADFIPALRRNCGTWTGRVYGLPMACDVITLLYRTDVFAARSAEFKRLTGRALLPPKTWPEYLEIARFLNGESLYGNILMGREQLFTLWSGVLWGLGGDLVDERWHPVLNSPVGVQSLTLFSEIFKCAPPGSQDLGFTEANALFLQGKGAMYLTWPSLIWAQLKDTNACKIRGRIGTAVIPGAHPELSAWCLGINSVCRDPEAAYRWIEFFSSKANTKRLLLLYGKGSPRLSTYEDADCARAIPYLSQLLEGFAGSRPRLRIPPSQELSDFLDNQLPQVILGQTTPQAALDRAAARWRSILTETGYYRE